METRLKNREKEAAVAKATCVVDVPDGTSQPKYDRPSNMDRKVVDDMIGALDSKGCGSVDVGELMGALAEFGYGNSAAYKVVADLSGKVSADDVLHALDQIGTR